MEPNGPIETDVVSEEGRESVGVSKTAPLLHGNVDALSCLDVMGWAWNSDMPDQTVSVELLADGKPFARVEAGEFRDDLLASNIGDGHHAFKFSLPSLLCNGFQHLISARVVETGGILNGTPLIFKTTGLLEGALDKLEGTVLTGWVRHINNNEEILSVTLLDNGKPVATAMADGAYEGGGNHRFRIPLPSACLDGLPHRFTAWVVEPPYLVGELFTDEQYLLMLEDARAHHREINYEKVPVDGYLGYVESVEPTRINGWCVNVNKRSQVPELELLADGKKVGSFYPSIARAEVEIKYPGANLSEFHIHIGAETAKKIISLLRDVSDVESEVRVDVKASDSQTPLSLSNDVYPYIRLNDLRLIADGNYYKSRDPFYVRFERMRAASASIVQKPQEEDVKLIAFYLPQFHPFPENNEWWGEGFTEWTNVARSKPLFDEHYQPHLPAELGFYDLRLAEVRDRQAQLAREYGIYGFCYHYYWFGGRPLMDMPIRNMLETGKPDFPFCICWANEPWSRRWDGSESEVLIAQPHDLEADEQFIIDVMPYLRDSRYIRVNDAPLLLIYRVSLLNNPRELFRRWRLIAADHGIADLHIVMAETFGITEPNKYGCDAAVSFPPHHIKAKEVSENVHGLNAQNFTGKIYDYREVVNADIARPTPGYSLYRGVMPSWDNTPRRGNGGHVYHLSSPEYYEYWLSSLIEITKREFPKEQRIVFINAWNEWGEGAHLEPDRRFGRKYLDATKRAIDEKIDTDYALSMLEVSANPTNKAQFDKALAAIRFEVEALRRSNDYMSEQYMSTCAQSNIKKSAWIKQDFFPFEQVDWSAISTRLSIDKVNQYDAEPIRDEIPLSRHQPVEILGWFLTEGLTKPGVLYLIAQGDNDLFVALIRKRVEREDVNLAYPGIAKTPAGFEVEIPLLPLPSGLYRMSMVITDGNAWKGARCPFRMRVI